MSTRRAAVPATVMEALYREYGGPTELTEARPLDQIVLFILSRGCDFRRAQATLKKLQTLYVDWNEVRATSAYELRKITATLGPLGPGDKADQVKELLSTIFHRFNKVNLDFLAPGSTEVDASRKREKFLSWLQDRFPPLAALTPLIGQERGTIAGHPSLARVLQRLNWMAGKSGGITAMRAAFQKCIPEEDRFRGQWALLHLGDVCCVARQPLCVQCPVTGHCPSTTEPRPASKTASKGKAAARKPAASKARTRVRK